MIWLPYYSCDGSPSYAASRGEHQRSGGARHARRTCIIGVRGSDVPAAVRNNWPRLDIVCYSSVSYYYYYYCYYYYYDDDCCYYYYHCCYCCSTAATTTTTTPAPAAATTSTTTTTTITTTTTTTPSSTATALDHRHPKYYS